jgi:acetyl esterase/lipase
MSTFKTALVLALLSTTAFPLSAAEPVPADYERYYPQFVDSKEPLAVLAERDMASWVYKPLSELIGPDMAKITDVAFGSHPQQKLDIYRWKDSTKRPVIFFIHGGGWAVGDKNNAGHFAIPGSVWLSLGYVVVSVNYRLGLIARDDPTAASRIASQPIADQPTPETRHAHPAQINDCAMGLKWVIDHIAEYGGDPNAIAITGVSAGGHLTALLATNRAIQQQFGIDPRKIKCWIPVSGIYDCAHPGNYSQPWMPAFMRALLDDQRKAADASPTTHVTGVEPPCLIVAGADDWLVPRTNSFLLFDKLREKQAANAEFELLSGYWHNTAFVRYLEPRAKSARIINRFLAVHIPSEGNHAKLTPNDVLVRLDHRTIDFVGAQPYLASDGTVFAPSTYLTDHVRASLHPEAANAYKVLYRKKTMTLSERAMVRKDGNVFVPVRAVSEALGAKVEWISATQTLVVTFN